MEETKKCSKCGEVKPLALFTCDSRRKDGRKSECQNCTRASRYLAKWKKANPDKVAEYAVRYRRRHPETGRKAQRKWKAAHLEAVREADRIRQSARRRDPEFRRLWDAKRKAAEEAKRIAQAKRQRADECDICHERGKTVFDHCHASGRFRGWLCQRCNRVLGSVKDSIELLERMKDYLSGETDSKTTQEHASGGLRSASETRVSRE